MSHFSVHVFIADDEPYDQLEDHLTQVLAPYDENLVSEERNVGSLSDADVAEAVKKYELGSAQEFIDDHLGHTARRNEDDTGWDLFTTYNPNSKWDWWTVGGRFEGTLHGGNGTTAHVDDLNAEEAVEAATKEAHALYDRLEAATAGLEAPTPFRALREHYASHDQAREVYHAQPWVKAATAVMPEYTWVDPMYFFHHGSGGRDAFVLEQSSLDVPFAYVDVDGRWHSSREMGWFGFHSDLDGLTYRDYVDGYRTYVKSLPNDCEVVVVDMHI